MLAGVKSLSHANMPFWLLCTPASTQHTAHSSSSGSSSGSSSSGGGGNTACCPMFALPSYLGRGT